MESPVVQQVKAPDERSSLIPQAGDFRRTSFFLSRGGMQSSMLNLICSTIGAGILTLPYAFSCSGVLLGIVMIVICAVATILSIELLVRVTDRTGLTSYDSMSQYLLGPRSAKVSQISMIAFCYGVAVGYIVALHDVVLTFQPSFPHWLRFNHSCDVVTAIFFLVVILPITAQRQISAFRFSSLFNVLSVIYLSVIIIWHFYDDKTASAHHGHHHHESSSGILKSAEQGEHHWLKDVYFYRTDYAMIMAVPLMSFSFCCQPNVLDIYSEMKNASLHTMMFTAKLGVWMCTVLYILVGVAGYADFTSHHHHHGIVEPNILSELDPMSSTWMFIAFLAVIITVATAFPLTIYPTKESIRFLFQHDTFERYNVWIAAGLATSACVLGIYAPSLTVVFGFLGGVCGSLIGYIFPAIFALRAGVPSSEDEPKLYIATWMLLIGGICAGAIGTWTSILSAHSVD